MPETIFVVLCFVLCTVAGEGAKCSDAEFSSTPACIALTSFRRTSDLRDAAQKLSAVVALDGRDWVCLEYLGGVLGMMARRMLHASEEKRMLTHAEKLLQRAADTFAEAYRWRFASSNSGRRDYPQVEFAQPLSLSLRAWGDALAWQGKHIDAGRVFGLGVEHGIWLDPVCRPEFNFPQSRRSHPRIWSGTVARDLFPSVVQKFGDALDDIIAEWKSADDDQQSAGNESRGWREESAGLHSGKRWSQLPILVNGEFQDELCKSYFPRLCDLLRSTASVHLRNGQVKFSAMHSGTVVRPHAGPVNSRLRAHCTIHLPPPSAIREMWIRVGANKQVWVNRSCFVFDESCEHEVVFQAPDDLAKPHHRVVLIIDFANPFLANEADYVEAHVETFQAKAKSEFHTRRKKSKNEDL